MDSWRKEVFIVKDGDYWWFFFLGGYKVIVYVVGYEFFIKEIMVNDGDVKEFNFVLKKFNISKDEE